VPYRKDWTLPVLNTLKVGGFGVLRSTPVMPSMQNARKTEAFLQRYQQAFYDCHIRRPYGEKVYFACRLPHQANLPAISVPHSGQQLDCKQHPTCPQSFLSITLDPQPGQ
jgi:hypothetical protein